MKTPVIQAKEVKQVFSTRGRGFRSASEGVKALDGVSLALFPGETFGLVGESGCGKSTLGRCFTGLQVPTSGAVLFKGESLGSLRKESRAAFRRDVQIVFQDPYSSLNPVRTVGDSVRQPLDIHDLYDARERNEIVASLLTSVGLKPEDGKRFPRELSGGQRQRVAIARAIALKPRVIIADEAVSGLDVSVRAQILNLFLELQEESGLGYLFISHDMSVIRHVSDSVGVMFGGKIIERGPVERVLDSPEHPYTRALIGAVPGSRAKRANAASE
jgi:ABC-type oligopeptide transport system ATPase subunit